MKNWKANAMEGVIFSVPPAAIIVLAKWVAIMVVPAMADLPLFDLALLVFPIGLYWGWIFARQGSLVGSSVSHAILGVFALFVVGFPGL